MTNKARVDQKRWGSGRSTVSTLDVVGYPDSGKIAVVAGIDASKGVLAGAPWVRTIFKQDQASLDYYDGEA